MLNKVDILRENFSSLLLYNFHPFVESTLKTLNLEVFYKDIYKKVIL